MYIYVSCRNNAIRESGSTALKNGIMAVFVKGAMCASVVRLRVS